MYYAHLASARFERSVCHGSLMTTYLYIYIYIYIYKTYITKCNNIQITGADSAFVIRGGPNSEHFLSNLRKLIKRGKFFLTIESLIVKTN